MLEMNKDYSDMGTNYKRRLGSGDNFLTTKQKGKRIEVKSDILTKIYNKKIMKNLKTMIEDFHNEAKKRIANGEFEVVSSSTNVSSGYIGRIDIKIDGLEFKFSLPKNNEFICDHSDVKIYPYHIDEKELNVLKKAFYDFTKEDRDNQIKELQEKIAELQK